MTTKIDKDTWSKALYQFVEDDAEILPLEKATDGRTTLDDIGEALAEYKKLFKAGIASKAEILTLSRAFPDSPEYTEAAKPFRDVEPMVVGGPASVELIDREGHMITSNALKKAFGNYMKSFRTRNAMVLHSDVQVGWCLPAYISKGGQIFKSGVDDKGLFFVCELRDDTRIAKRVMEQVNEGKLKSYSIAGSATKIENVQKGLVPYMRVDDMELAEVTVCEKGVNQSASFDLLKAEEDEEGKEEIKKELPKIKKELFFKSNEDVDFLATFVNYNDTIINKGKKVEVDVEKVIRYIADHIINGRGYVVRLNNDIIGAALVKEADYWFSKETFLNEGVFYVSAKARRTPAAKLLLNELKAYARELNLPLMIGVTTGDRLKAKDKFFEMNSFKRVGGMYVLRI